jgi:hypothetical protein
MQIDTVKYTASLEIRYAHPCFWPALSLYNIRKSQTSLTLTASHSHSSVRKSAPQDVAGLQGGRGARRPRGHGDLPQPHKQRLSLNVCKRQIDVARITLLIVFRSVELYVLTSSHHPIPQPFFKPLHMLCQLPSPATHAPHIQTRATIYCVQNV